MNGTTSWRSSAGRSGRTWAQRWSPNYRWKSYHGHYVSEKDATSSFDVKVKKGARIISRPGAWGLPLTPTNGNEYLLPGGSLPVRVAFMGDGELWVTQGEVTVYWRE